MRTFGVGSDNPLIVLAELGIVVMIVSFLVVIVLIAARCTFMRLASLPNGIYRCYHDEPAAKVGGFVATTGDEQAERKIYSP